MSSTVVTKAIAAPVEAVFRTVADISQFSRAVPHIVNVEFLSPVKSGVGTRFRETRVMRGKKVDTELEITEFVENNRVRYVADSHGTVWDTVFTVESDRDFTLLTMTMDAKTKKLIPKIMNRLIRGMVKKAVAQDMDAVKKFCEQQPH